MMDFVAQPTIKCSSVGSIFHYMRLLVVRTQNNRLGMNFGFATRLSSIALVVLGANLFLFVIISTL